MSSGVYKITLRTDNRIYIGSAIDIEDRWKNHLHNASSKRDNVQVITRAIRKYGKDAFEWEIIEYCDINCLIDREQYYLDTLQPFVRTGLGFNIRETADSNLGITASDETKRKMSTAHKGRVFSDEHKENMSKGWHKNRGDDYYAGLSERMKGNNNPSKNPIVRKKISDAMTGKSWKHDEKRMQNHIAARVGKTYSEEARANMKAAQQKNNTRSAEAKEKFYLAQRKLYKITTPTGESFELYSRELKIYCKEHSLQYGNLISTAKTRKFYKDGWIATLLT